MLASGLSARAANALRLREYPEPQKGLAEYLYSNFRRDRQDIFGFLETGGTIRGTDGGPVAIPLPTVRKYAGGKRVTLATFTAVTGLETFTGPRRADGSRLVFAKDARVGKAGKAGGSRAKNRDRLRARGVLRAVPVFRLQPDVTIPGQFDYGPVRDFAEARLSDLFVVELGRRGVLD